MKIQSPYIDRRGQIPITRFLPLDQSVEVKIVSVTVPDHLQEFVTACHKSSPHSQEKWTREEILAKIGEGKTLWQCGEIIKFGVRCTNVSRVLTHQMVRARVGVSFSQQCTGDVDCRHLDFVKPNCFPSMSSFEDVCVSAKSAYVDAVDEKGISIQEARYLLPMGLSGHIYLDICLGSLAEMHRKRMCTMTQTWEFIIWTEKLRAEIERVAPWALPMFPSRCRNCWFKQTAMTPFANTHLWYPDLDHRDAFPDRFEPDFVHGMARHYEISSGPQAGIKHFVENYLVEKETYDRVRAQYKVD